MNPLDCIPRQEEDRVIWLGQELAPAQCLALTSVAEQLQEAARAAMMFRQKREDARRWQERVDARSVERSLYYADEDAAVLTTADGFHRAELNPSKRAKWNPWRDFAYEALLRAAASKQHTLWGKLERGRVWHTPNCGCCDFQYANRIDMVSFWCGENPPQGESPCAASRSQNAAY